MDRLSELRALIAAHAQPDMRTPIDGLLLSVEAASETPDYSLTEPLVVVLAQGGKRLLLGDDVYEYRAGQCLVVTADLPVTGHFIDTGDGLPSLGMALVLRPAVVAELVLQAPFVRRVRNSGNAAMSTADADEELLDAVVRLVRLIEKPSDAGILAPLIEREIIWRLLTGPQGETVRQIGMADSNLTYVSRAIGWIRQNYAEPMRIEELAQLAGMSPSTFHRHFRAVTAMSPLQFQKRIRLQEARSMLVTAPGDIAGVGHRVGYDSPSQFTREYRRLFGAPPGQDALRLRQSA
ncbi:AraC family transcriptional regulator [Mycobacterium sp. ENV421]|uniref:AraC family transcriptional regulator n=1 Tax=Mycobacterium sp. ENV421 TaxID=1213407 RepID=UPI000C9A2802|nr:AraC family transcriptional regulator [Mycobacterium sp. ENV421]PND59148.1 AraC family transcriptional regulator [Mycobacterium sp. ENV421]